MKIAIKFGDNDFHSTFHGVLTAINESYIYNKDSKDDLENLTKKDILYMINSLSYPMYQLRQSVNIKENDIKSYLQIKENQLYLNDDAIQLIQDTIEEGTANCDIFILDTDLNYKNNFPVYSL